jgi:hypothetical protein
VVVKVEAVEVHLDEAELDGYLLVRDSVTHKELLRVYEDVAKQGWEEVDPPEEGIEAWVFPDGERGVKIALYKIPVDQEV